jgi:hypothetical protein
MDLAKPRLYGILKYRGEAYSPRAILSKGHPSHGLDCISTSHIEGKTYFWRPPSIVTKILPLVSHQGGGGATPHQNRIQRRIRGKGPLARRAAAPLGAAATPLRWGSSLPSSHWGGSSPLQFTTPLHHPLL